MPSVEYDLRYLRAGVPLLEQYLMSNEVYWPVGVKAPAGETPYPRLTLGGLLLAQKRLHAQELDANQRSELAALDEEMDGVRSRWRVAWGSKASADFKARLRLWRDFLEEYRKDKNNNADRYPYEVSRRVLLQLVRPDADNLEQADRDVLAGLDSLLRAFVEPGQFIWEPKLESGFPHSDYWYLYGRLRTE
jgi:hypothetical protein